MVPVRLSTVLCAFAKFHETKTAVRLANLLSLEQVAVEIFEDTARVRHVFAQEGAEHAIRQVVVSPDVRKRIGDGVCEARVGQTGNDREDTGRKGPDTGNIGRVEARARPDKDLGTVSTFLPDK